MSYRVIKGAHNNRLLIAMIQKPRQHKRDDIFQRQQIAIEQRHVTLEAIPGQRLGIHHREHGAAVETHEMHHECHAEFQPVIENTHDECA